MSRNIRVALWVVLLATSLSAAGESRADPVREPETTSLPEANSLRTPGTHVEFFSFRVQGSNYGAGGILSFFRLCWRWFYLEPLRIQGGGGGPGYDWADKHGAWYAKGGIMLGLPIVFGSRDQHEFRFGAGVSGGFMHNEESATYWNTYATWAYESFGPFVDVEAYYLVRFARHLALTVGFDCSVVTRYEQPNYRIDNWKPENIYSATIGLAF
ncbi:MAG TPA: hypothetical protein PK313_03930 [Myxococcota bacterium]|nr:hypothetical protein [Myxococcota bacterium]